MDAPRLSLAPSDTNNVECFSLAWSLPKWSFMNVNRIRVWKRVMVLGLSMAGCGVEQEPLTVKSPVIPSVNEQQAAVPDGTVASTESELFLNLAPEASSSTEGRWDPEVHRASIGLINAVLLPNKKVLVFGRRDAGGVGKIANQSRLLAPTGGNAYTWKEENDITEIGPVKTDVFCAGQTHLANGKVLVSGGHITNYEGRIDLNIFDPAKNLWTRTGQTSKKGRWYPTTTVLGNGNVFIMGGTVDKPNNVQRGNLVPELYNPRENTLVELRSAGHKQNLYPWNFQISNGNIFCAGPSGCAWNTGGGDSAILNTTTWKWEAPIRRSGGAQDYGSAVMFAPDQVLVTGGGGGPIQQSAQRINLSGPAPKWVPAGTMNFRRRQHNSTVLADGTVFISGGTSMANFTDPAEAGKVLAPELWRPSNNTFQKLPPMKTVRTYHAFSLLLPNGTVMVGGGGYAGKELKNYPDFEIYYPPYLFDKVGNFAPRPQITNTKVTTRHGAEISIGTPQAQAITRATLVKLGSVTHSFDQDQRFVPLAITGRTATAVKLKIPANPNALPPGHYMLFIFQGRVPSLSKIILVEQ
jgi:galactose oxidase